MSRPAARPVPRWQMALMVWISLLPPALILNLLVLPRFPGIPALIGVLASSLVSVAFVVWVGLPVMARFREFVLSRNHTRTN